MVFTMKTHSHGLQRQALASTSAPRTVRCRPCAAGRKRHVSVRATATPPPPPESSGEAALPASIGGMSTEEEDLVRFGIPAAEIPPPPEPDRFYGVKGFMYATSEGEIAAETTTPPVVFSTVDMAEIKPPPERFEGLGGFKSADGTFIAGDERFIASNTSSSGTSDSSKSSEPPKQDKKPEVEQEAVKGLKGYKSVFVAGASGGVGRRVVEALHAEGVPVRALVREYSKGGELPGLSTTTTLVKGDVTQFATLAAAIGDADAVVVATGASGITDPLGPFNVDYQGTLNLIALAKQRGVKKFVMVSSIGTDDILNPLNLFYGVLFWKKRAEEELQRSGLDYTIIRPGLLLPVTKAFGLPLPIPGGFSPMGMGGGFSFPQGPQDLPSNRDIASRMPSSRDMASNVPSSSDIASNLPTKREVTSQLPDEVSSRLPQDLPSPRELASNLPDPKELVSNLPSPKELASQLPSPRGVAQDIASKLPSPQEVASKLPKEITSRLPPLPSAGGLKNNLRAGEMGGNVVMAPPNTYGVPPLRTAGAILRRQVAEVCVAALGEEAASNKVVEVIADKDAMPRSYEDLFSSVTMSM